MGISQFFSSLFQNWPAKVLSFAAALLLLVFHDITRLEERFLTVPLEVLIQSELVPGASYPQQVRVRLRGESEAVFGVLEQDLRAFVDLREHDNPGEYRAPVQVRRTGELSSNVAIEIQVEPESIGIVLEEKMLKSVEVVASTSGFPPSGYELVQVLMTPSAVEVEGPRSRVEPIEQVRTEDVDLSSKREDFTERLRLVKPDPLVSFPGGDIVELRGIVEEKVVLTTFQPVDVVVVGLNPQYRLGQNLPTGLVRVQARQLDIEETELEDIQLVIDASQVDEPGTIRLPVRPQVPPGFLVLRYEPTSLLLVVEEGE